MLIDCEITRPPVKPDAVAVSSQEVRGGYRNRPPAAGYIGSIIKLGKDRVKGFILSKIKCFAAPQISTLFSLC